MPRAIIYALDPAMPVLLHSMRSPLSITELQRQAVERGLTDPGGLTHLVTQLVAPVC